MSTSAPPDLEGFERTYRRHVAMVESGDLEGVMADMAPDAIPSVFDGVTTPKGRVVAADLRDFRVEGPRAVGECVYTTASGAIGLRSGWRYDGGAWLADTLENFEA